MNRILLLLALLFTSTFLSDLYASHVMGADLTYECIGPNQYRVTLTGYRDCQGIPLTGPIPISVQSTQCGVTINLTLNQVGQPVDITPVCATGGSSCQGGSGIGIEKDVFQGILTLPAGCGSDWTLIWDICCRNAAITTINQPDNDDLTIVARLNNTLASCDNSPQFSNDPVGVYCNNNIYDFNHGAVDADGDSLWYYFMPSLNGSSSVSYRSPYSATNPIGSSPAITINGSNGQLHFDPNQTQVAVIKVGVDEFRNGVLIGHIERDMQVIVTGCTNNPPVSGGINGAPTSSATAFTYNTTACSNFCFTVQTSDPQAADSIKYRFLSQDLPGATITSSGGTKPLLTICWAPTQNDVGTHTFVIALRDNACPYNGTASQGYTINVVGASNPPVNAGRDTTLCPGQTTTLTATSAGTVTSYQWSDGTNTHSGATWANINPSVTTIYTVTATYSNGCQLTDQVIVRRNPQPTITAFPPVSTICSTADTVQITAITAHAASYQWSPAIGLTCTTCASPKISPPASQSYTVVAKDSFGCTSPPFTVTVNLNSPPPTQSCSVLYGTPNGTGNGTQASPGNLATVLGLAQCNNAVIKLGIGTYTIDYPITNIGSNTTIEGGFDPAANWKKNSTPGATTIYRSTLGMESNSRTKRLVAIYLNGAQYVLFQDLTLQTANCPATLSTDTFGASNYVIHMTNCSNYSFVRCQIIPGTASNGSVGVNATGAGANGNPGGNASGSAKAGAAGGAGPNAGGTGGNGGNGGTTSGGAGTAGSAGTGASGGAGGTRGGGVTICSANASAGGNGGNGGNGSTGAPGAPGSISGNFFVDGGRGVDGTPGTNGSGGGGGGGNGGGGLNYDGSGGGGGGSGGIGGPGGTGGGSGGGCFGIFSNSNGANGVLLQCNIGAVVPGIGGLGGTGSGGGTGGAGGSGGINGSNCQNTNGKGGKGGDGGQGGNGGSGADGAAARVYIVTGSPLITGDSAFALSAQPAIAIANISCTQRPDTLSAAAAGSWNAGAGASPATGATSPFFFQYTTTGRKDIVYNANTYAGFANIALDQSTFIPVIQSSAAVLQTDTFWLCKGSTSSFNIQIASADTFQWDFGGATTPNTYYGSTKQNLTGLTFNTAGTFLIQARIKTSCCGWSPYDTAYLVVEPKSTINYTGVTTFCPGDSVHIILGGTASSYSWAPAQGVSNPAGSNVYIAPQVTTTYLATAYSPRGLCNADTSITITKLNKPTLTFTTTPAACGPTGSATVIPAPTGTYTYYWSNTAHSTTATISSQPSATYSVTVTPQGTTCSVTGATSISAAGGLQAFFINTVAPKCFGQCTGTVRVKAIGGTAPYTYHWGTSPATIDSIKNLCAGTYDVTITDASGCTAAASQQLLAPQLLVAAILDSASPMCPGQCTGFARGDGSGGTGPYSIHWSNAGATGTRDTLLCAGTYTMTVTDVNLCSANTTFKITTPPAMVVALTTINDSCFGVCDGEVKASVTNGQGTLHYQWNGGTSTLVDSVKGICAGLYGLVVTDSLSCSVTASATITQPTAVAATISNVINDSCFSQCNGRATAAGSGGTGPYTYVWNNLSTTGKLDSNLCIGTYTVTVKDALGCKANTSVTITQPTVLMVAITGKINDSCTGLCHGGATAATSGGTAPYTYKWSNPANSTGATVNNLCAGTYTVTAKDAMGCIATTTVTITEPSALSVTIGSVINDSCYHVCNGSAVASAAGGTGPYTYAWSNGNTTAKGSALCAQTYTVTAKDALGCTVATTVTLTEPTQLSVALTSTINDSCFGQCNGSALVTASNGTTPYTYAWSNSNTTNNPKNLCAATYTVTVQDALKCKATTTATITQPVALTVAITTQIDVTCHGACDGAASATASDGTGPYTYAWAASAGSTASNLCAGTYTVTAKDALGCTAATTVTISEPAALTISVSGSTNVSCNGVCDGTITTATAGGTAAYSYLWSNNSTIGNPTGLCSSVNPYSVVVTDAHGCTATTGKVITEPAALTLSIIDTIEPSCYGVSDGKIEVGAAGGTASYSYTLDAGTAQASGIFNGVAGGPHTVTVTDNHLCTTSISFTLYQPSQILVDTVSTKNISCQGGSDGTITLKVSGGTGPYSYSWPQAPAITDSLGVGLTAQTYVPKVTDSRGCFSSVTVTLTEPPLLTATVLTDSVSCNGGSDGKAFITTAGGTGPYSYELDASGTFQPADSFTALSAGLHTAVVKDAHGCTISKPFTIYEPQILMARIVNKYDINCNGSCTGLIIAGGTGGTLSYSYTTDAVTYYTTDSIKNLCAGNYTVTLLDHRGCSASVPVTIIEPTALGLVQSGSQQPTCFNGTNGTFTVTGSGGTGAYQFSSDSGAYQSSAQFTGQTVGTHFVRMKDANGCTDTLTVTVPNAPPNDTYTTAITNESCNGGSDGTITTTLAGGTTVPYTYTWSLNHVPMSPNPASAGLTGIAAGTYTVLIVDGNGCRVFGTGDSVVTQPAPITDTYTPTLTKCFGSSDGCVTVTPAGGTGPAYTHSWSNGDNTAAPCNFAAGTYTDTIRDANQCIHIDNNIVVTQPAAVSDTLAVTDITCAGDSNGTITVAPTGGTPNYSYSWSPIASNAQSISGLKLGTYTVVITDANGCTATDAATIKSVNPMVLNAQKKNVLCYPLKNGFIYLPVTGGTPGYNFVWDDDSQSNYRRSLSEGTYKVTITDANGCEIDTAFVVGNDSSFVLRVTPDTATIDQGVTVQLAADVTGGVLRTITWSPDYQLTCTDCTTPVASPLHTIEYSIHAVSDSGCISDATSLITVIPQHQLYVPNTFTPNDDGVNDKWEIYGNKKSWLFVEVSVYDRWGEKVFESNDINFAWDGSYKGTKLEPNVYVYVLKVVFVDDHTASNKGTITVLR